MIVLLEQHRTLFESRDGSPAFDWVMKFIRPSISTLGVRNHQRRLRSLCLDFASAKVAFMENIIIYATFPLVYAKSIMAFLRHILPHEGRGAQSRSSKVITPRTPSSFHCL